MNEPYYFRELIRMQNDDELYIAKGKVGYKNAVKHLDKNNWEINGVKYVKRYSRDTRDTVICTERPIDKLRCEIDFNSLKKGTLEKSCIDDELYLLGDYGFYYNGLGDWFFGIFEKIEIVETRLCYITYEYKKKTIIQYNVPKIEKLTNKNYKILLEGYEK